MRERHLLCGLVLQGLFLCVASTALTVSEIQATGKVLFRALRDSECKVKCKSRKPRIMCGSDGVSYLSKCEIKRARRCQGKNVTIKRKGKCSEKDVPMTKCLQARDEALTTSSRTGSVDEFIPDCSPDGTFADVQCHRASGYCWCVSKDGKPIPGTSVKNNRPNCGGETATPVIALKPPKNSSKSIQRKKSKRRKRGSRCSDSDRRKFNSNLVRVFTEEYNRSVRSFPTRSKRRATADGLERHVVDWKFSQYDKNTDNVLQRREVNALRRLVKKFIKPRSCAKRFLTFCDSDRNKLIATREWSVCLGVEEDNNDKTTQAPPEPEVTPSAEGIDRFYQNEKPSASSSRGNKEVRQNLPGPVSGPTTWQHFSRPRPVSKPKQDKKPKTCVEARVSALDEEAKNPDAAIFIPNCTPEGNWTPAQCHRSTGYCWCVDEANGRPISGTSTHDVIPSCDFETERRIEDCEYAEKQTFLSDLMSVLTAEMAEYAINGSEIRYLHEWEIFAYRCKNDKTSYLHKFS